MLRSSVAVTLALALTQAGAARADPKSLPDAIAQHAYPLTVQKGVLAGAGAAPLTAAIDGATFVLLGEDHGIEQVPAVAGALCTELAPHGFHRVALEVGPSVAPELARMAAAKDGAAQAAAFDHKYPESIAFYTWKEDFGFLSACARATAAQQAPLEVWGVDQELMGASQLLFQRILDAKPGAESIAAIAGLAKDSAAARAAAAKASDFAKLYMLSAPQDALDAAAAALAKDGNAAAQALFASFLHSRTIYQGQMGPGPYESNRDRARLMKTTFFDQLGAAASKDKAMPKVLVKLGAWHLYRGLNPLHSTELGNLIHEASEAHRVTMVNLLVLGVHGSQRAVTGPGKSVAAPLDLTAKDSPYAFLTPFFDHQAPKAWTLFDLRALRDDFGSYGALDPEMERLIFGYDFLVLIADPRPEHPL